jgi:hypothetical protein
VQVLSLAQRQPRPLLARASHAAAAPAQANGRAGVAGRGAPQAPAGSASGAGPESGRAAGGPAGRAPPAAAASREPAAAVPAPGIRSVTLTPTSTARRTLAEVNAQAPTYTGARDLLPNPIPGRGRACALSGRGDLWPVVARLHYVLVAGRQPCCMQASTGSQGVPAEATALAAVEGSMHESRMRRAQATTWP